LSGKRYLTAASCGGLFDFGPWELSSSQFYEFDLLFSPGCRLRRWGGRSDTLDLPRSC